MLKSNGLMVVANLTGTDTSDWTDRNGNMRKNLFLVLSETYQDRYGNPQTNVTRIAYSEARMNEINQFASSNAGQRVAIPVISTVRTGREGPFVTYFLPDRAQPEVLPDV